MIIARLSRAAFWVAIVALVVMALAPIVVHGGAFNDKAQHSFGFFVLTALGLIGWQRRVAVRMALALAALGGAIEILQGTSLIGRDAEFSDWIADLAGILAAVVPALFVDRVQRGTL